MTDKRCVVIRENESFMEGHLIEIPCFYFNEYNKTTLAKIAEKGILPVLSTENGKFYKERR